MTTKTKQIVQISLVKNNKHQYIDMEIPEILRVVDNQSEISHDSHVFRIMTPKDGDKRIVWDKHSLVQIRAAKEMFDTLIKEGLVPYLVGINGQSSSEVMKEFDPTAEEIIFVPASAIVGG